MHSPQQKLEGAESDIKYVRTLEGEPSPPRDLTATPLNFSAVKINWLPPKQPNGEIKYYEIEIEPIEINKKRILMKNSCDFSDDIPEDFDDSGVEKAKKPPPGQPNGPGGPNSQGECDCSSCPAPGAKGGPIDKNSQLDEVTFIDDIMNRVHQLDQDLPQPNPDQVPDKRKRRSVLMSTASDHDHGNLLENSGNSSSSSLVKDIFDNLNIDTEEVEVEKKEPIKIRIDVTADGSCRPGEPCEHTLAQGLKHFTTYNIKIRACQEAGTRPANFMMYGETECDEFGSIFEQREVRTQPKPNADNIPGSVRIGVPETTKPLPANPHCKEKSINNLFVFQPRK